MLTDITFSIPRVVYPVYAMARVQNYSTKGLLICNDSVLFWPLMYKVLKPRPKVEATIQTAL